MYRSRVPDRSSARRTSPFSVCSDWTARPTRAPGSQASPRSSGSRARPARSPARRRQPDKRRHRDHADEARGAEPHVGHPFAVVVDAGEGREEDLLQRAAMRGERHEDDVRRKGVRPERAAPRTRPIRRLPRFRPAWQSMFSAEDVAGEAAEPPQAGRRERERRAPRRQHPQQGGRRRPPRRAAGRRWPTRCESTIAIRSRRSRRRAWPRSASARASGTPSRGRAAPSEWCRAS